MNPGRWGVEAVEVFAPPDLLMVVEVAGETQQRRIVAAHVTAIAIVREHADQIDRVRAALEAFRDQLGN